MEINIVFCWLKYKFGSFRDIIQCTKLYSSQIHSVGAITYSTSESD